MQATAKDAAGNTLTAYNAAATWSDTSGLLAPVSPNNFANGVSTTNATISLPYPGDQITLSSGGQSSSTSSFDVLGPLDHFTFSVALDDAYGGRQLHRAGDRQRRSWQHAHRLQRSSDLVRHIRPSRSGQPE